MRLMDQSTSQPGDDLQALRIDRGRTARRASGGWRKRILPYGLIAVGLGAGILIGLRLKWEIQPGLAAKEVAVTTVGHRGSSGRQPVLAAGGYIIARNQVEVGSKATGRVIAFEVKEGDFVQPGQVIARLDNYEVKARMNQAEAALAAARVRLSELEAGSRPQEIDRAVADRQSADAELKNAEQNLRRFERLAQAGVIDQRTLDDASSRHKKALAAFQAAKANSDLVSIGPRREAIEVARAQVRQSEAELLSAKAEVENTIIRAPIAGIILDRYIDIGGMVTTGFTSNRGAKQALVAMANLQDLQVEMDISEADIAKVKIDQPAVITPDAYGDRHYKGVVEYIASVADRQKATIKVKVKVFDPDAYLRPDMGAKLTFYEVGANLGGEQNALLVPRSALVRQEDKTVVFVARDSTVAIRPVSAGREDGGYVEVVSGLQGGESVIISGQSGLKDGDKIVVRP